MEIANELGNFVFLLGLLLLVLIEAIWLICLKKQSFPWQEAGANFGVALIKRIVDIATYGAAASLLFWAYEYRLATFKLDSVLIVTVYFLLFEFVYYWHHRWAHEIRWMWATHSVHHSSDYMNLSVSARLGFTGLVSGSVLVFMPLVIIGFHPLLVILTLAVSLFYQVFLHTELVGKLGPLEWVLNTPSHHRVHHGSNRRYLNKNYGGVLIIFDRLFGTFAEEKEQVTYGLTVPINTQNPFKIALSEWINIAQDVKKAGRFSHAFGYMFGQPGWRPKKKSQLQKT